MAKQLLAALSILLLFACSKQPQPVAEPLPSSAPAEMAADSMQAKMVGGAEQSLTEISEPWNIAGNNTAKKYIALRFTCKLNHPLTKCKWHLMLQ